MPTWRDLIHVATWVGLVLGLAIVGGLITAGASRLIGALIEDSPDD
jgi:hypothetical protein